jgi:16S rRNA (cytidine1402-2'-O)-methyltransferase
MGRRAVEVLSSVDVIAAEDTRHSARLLQEYQIHTPTVSFHEHNEAGMTSRLLARLQGGERIALISDAGTPLINDPGYRLVCRAHDEGIRVVAVPGPSAVTAALSVAGLPTDRFVYEGFLPAKSAARQQCLTALAREPRTLVFFEAPHRLAATLDAMADVLGADRRATLVRELSKLHETVRRLPLAALAAWVHEDTQQQRGESVIIVEGYQRPAEQALDEETRRLLGILLEALSTRQAADIAARITGIRRNTLYQAALELGGGHRQE